MIDPQVLWALAFGIKEACDFVNKATHAGSALTRCGTLIASSVAHNPLSHIMFAMCSSVSSDLAESILSHSLTRKKDARVLSRAVQAYIEHTLTSTRSPCSCPSYLYLCIVCSTS